MTNKDSDRRLHPIDDTLRIVAVEEKLSFQQQTLDQLNEVVLQQQADLQAVRNELKEFRAQVDRLADQGSEDDLPHEKPPHY